MNKSATKRIVYRPAKNFNKRNNHDILLSLLKTIDTRWVDEIIIDLGDMEAPNEEFVEFIAKFYAAAEEANCKVILKNVPRWIREYLDKNKN
ncbi:MAG: hypothetical protein Kow0090_05700 [Myxococcota bacterium]